MCGRFVATQSADQMAQFFGAVAHGPDPQASYNVAPTNDVLGVVEAQGERRVESFRWGLVPSWAKDMSIGSRMINARAETLTEKPSFKGLFRKRRVLVPMDGFYEWQAGPAGKTPMYIHRADGTPLVVAGLWSAWHDPAAPASAPWLHTCTLITTSANSVMAPVHDRMPVLLEPDQWGAWLDPDNDDVGGLQHLLRPCADHVLTMHPVSTLVNQVRNKGPELIGRTDPG
jgi:putative SOS response-associated peptidase YedK